MVKIELISFENNIANIKCYPEGHNENMFTMILDIENKKVINKSENAEAPYTAHAAWKIFDTYERTGQIPKKTMDIWY